jgi:hypothetical protein
MLTRVNAACATLPERSGHKVTCEFLQVENKAIIEDPVRYRRGFHVLAIFIAALAAFIVTCERLGVVAGATSTVASAPQTAPAAVSKSLASTPPHPLPLQVWWCLLVVTVVAFVLSCSRAAIMRRARSRSSKMADDLAIAALHAALFAAYWEAVGVWVLVIIIISFIACLVNMRRACYLGNRSPYTQERILTVGDWVWSAVAEVLYAVALLCITGQRHWQTAAWLPLAVIGLSAIVLRTVWWSRCAIADVAEYVTANGEAPTVACVDEICGEGVLAVCSFFGYTTGFWTLTKPTQCDIEMAMCD